MKLERNDVIALVMGAGLITLAVSGKIDWTAAVAWLIGLLQRQPTIVTGPPVPPGV